jgi:superfamily II DNA or RNA helicase
MDKALFNSYLTSGMDPSEMKTKIQNAAWAIWTEKGCKGTIEAATGVGKTRIAVMAARMVLDADPNALVYVCVPTETLRDVEWPAEIVKWWPQWDGLRINFICHVSMHTIRENQEISLCIFDEIHHVTAQNVSFFENNVVREVMGLSATVAKKSIEGEFDKVTTLKRIAPVVFSVSLKEATALKLVAEFDIILLKFALNSTDFNVPYTSGKTVKKTVMTTEAANYKRLTKTLGKAMRSKHTQWKFGAMQQRADFVRNFPTKTKIAKDVLEQILTDGTRTLVFCGSIEQSVSLCGGQVYNSTTSDLELRRFSNKEISHLGAVMALNEGKNIPDVEQIFIVQVSASERDLIQRIGRTIRWRDGFKAKVIILIAAGTVDEKWADKALKGIDKRRITTYNVK